MAGTQPPTISGPNAASGPVNGLNSPTTSVDAEELPPEEPQAAIDKSASAAPSAATATLITHLQMMSRQHRSASGVVRRPGGAGGDGLFFYHCVWNGRSCPPPD